MPRRIALVVGIGRYQAFAQLPTALRDAETMGHVLKQVAALDEVRVLTDPDAGQLAEASEYLFADKETDDLLLFYFSGHGVKDERGQLHLAVPRTRKHASGELVRATAVSCRHVHDIMSASRSRRQVVILDCCFSGAFADGLQPKDGGHVDLRSQLGGEGRAVLTSSASTQFSFDASESGLSTYTQYIVNGIATGEADLNHDGQITIDELREYAKARVQISRPAMSPQILPTREGYSIVISAARKADPGRAYAAKVRELASAGGELTRVAAQVLALRRAQLGLSDAQADAIEATELGPRRARANARAILRRAVYQARRRGRIHSEQSLLNELRVALDLGESELAALLAEPLSAQQAIVLGGWFSASCSPPACSPSSPPSPTSLSPSARASPTPLSRRAWPPPRHPADPPSRASRTPPPTRSTSPRTAHPRLASRPRPRSPILPSSTNPTPHEVEKLPPAPGSEPPSNPGSEPPSNPDITTSSWVIRLTSNYSLDEAKQWAATLADHTLDGVALRPQIVKHGTFHCILIGPYASEDKANRLLYDAKQLLRQGGYVQYMPRWCPYMDDQIDGVRRCYR